MVNTNWSQVGFHFGIGFMWVICLYFVIFCIVCLLCKLLRRFLKFRTRRKMEKIKQFLLQEKLEPTNQAWRDWVDAAYGEKKQHGE